MQRVSLCANKLKKVHDKFTQEEVEISQDLEMFYAPRECYGIAFRGFEERQEKELNKVLAEFGYTSYEEFMKELREVIGCKAIYRLGL
jgi:hypothetical protein